jgi:hypothetical protein
MDPQRFDQLARQVGRNADRRHVVKAAASGALALIGLGAVRTRTSAASGKDGDPCSTSADCETGLICEGASSGLLGGLIAEGPYGPPAASSIFGPSDGKCRYRSDNCAKSGQYCNRNSDCCNGLNLICRGHECKRRN